MTREEGRWRLELSRPAVGALRALPRADQRLIAARLEDLESSGPPPTVVHGRPIELRVGEHLLVCVVDVDARRVVVVTLHGVEEAASGLAVARMARRWIRDLMGGEGMESVLSDVRLALRSLLRARGFAVASIVTLALGIGATSAIFSVANGVLLEPLPYGDSDRVVTVWSRWSGYPKTWVSLAEYLNYHQQNRTLEDAALYFTSSHNFTSADNPERVGSGVVTPNTFDVLGVEPLVGRAFTWEEALAEEPVIVLGHAVWQRRYGGDPSVVGRDVEVNGRLFTVLGVLPERFVLPQDYGSSSPSEVFFALPADRDASMAVPVQGGSHGYYMIGRLLDGVTVAEARADLSGLTARLESEGVYPAEMAFSPLVFKVKDDIVGPARATILVLAGACFFLLLIACGNVANLMLSRSEGRMRDVAVRHAMGAGRGRILRQLLTESAVIAGLSAVLGLALSYWGIGFLLSIHPDSVPRSESVGLDGTVVLFTLAVSAATALLCGWVPAARVSGVGVGGVLREAGRGPGSGARSNRVQGVLVMAQMSMAVVLLAGAGLMMRTFVQYLRVDPGFQAENVLTMRLTAPSMSYPDNADVVRFYDELLGRIRAIPGVRDAGATRQLPLASQMGDSGFRVLGYEAAPGESPTAEWQYVTPRYVEVMGIPLKEGRSFDERDIAGSRVVMMVNEAAVRRYWSGRSPIGTRVDTFGGDTATVVGVVGDIRHNGITAEIKPRYYRAQSQIDGPGNIRRMTVAIRGETDAESLIEPVRRAVRALDPTMPVSEVRTMETILDGSVAQPRFAMVLLGVFGVLALTLAVIGVYGVLAYAVSLRTQEIGVRMALGAAASHVVRQVVRQGMAMALVGVATGTLLAFALTRFMEGQLYNVQAQDPATFVSVPVLFAAVALFACWLPAARAARVEPSAALRYE